MELPCEQIGPYRLTRRIGSGGIGQVFAAVHERTDREVALKLLSPESAADPQLVARFLQEARALAGLQHAGVVRALHCDRLPDGTAYLAMEYLDGATLRAWAKRQEGPVPLEAALFIAREIADAMVEVHGKGIVHRDLKPENIMLVADAGSPIGHRVKLLDFGIAKVPRPPDEAHADTRVQTGAPTLLGTATYMAPEQCRNVAGVTDRADVYALGAVLFELVTGRPPFESDDPVELMAMHLREEPPHLEDLAPHVPPMLGSFVSSMLAKDPSARPSMERCRDMLARPWQAEGRACPFPGLAPFTELHAELFFGRAQALADLEPMLEGLARGEPYWLRIEGPGGSGKTSLVQAAVLPGLGHRFATGTPWRVATLRPAAAPISSLARAVASIHGEREDELEAAMRGNEEALAAILRRSQPSGSLLLLVIEQLEELFTRGAPDLARFDALLFHALTAPDARLRLLTTMRSDHAHALDRLPRLASLDGRTRRYYLKPIEEEGLREVIRGLTSRAGLRLSEGLAERIARDAIETDHRLPLLGHMLRSLWSSRPGLVLTHEHYERLGGIGGALLQQANALLEGLGEDGRERARWVVLDLVQVGRGTPDMRRSRTRAEVLAAAGGDHLAEDVLARLSGGSTTAQPSPGPAIGLVALSSDPGADPSQPRIELAHDTLLRQVPAIASWISRDRDLLERHADLEAAASAWHQIGCPIEGLPTGALLAHYAGLDAEAHRRGRPTPMASEPARRFLRSAQALERRRSLRRRIVVAALVGCGIVIAASAVHAWQQRRRAEANLQSVILMTKQVVSETDWQLGRVLYTLDARKRQLQYIDDTLASLPEDDTVTPEVIVAIAETKHRRSDLARLNESLSRADAFITEARRQIDRGRGIDRSDRRWLELAALNHSKRAKVALARGTNDAARAELAASVALLHQMGGDGNDYRRTLATSHAEYAEAELAIGDRSAAAARADAAIELLERNAAGDGVDADYDRSQLALALRLRAIAARDGGDLGTAVAHLERARSLQERLVGRHDGNAYYQWILAAIDADLAVVRHREGRLADAAGLFRNALELAEELHRGEDTQKEYALLLCRTSWTWAELARDRSDLAVAGEARSRACKIAADLHAKDPEDARFRSFPCR